MTNQTIPQRIELCRDLLTIRARLESIPFEKKPQAKAVSRMRQDAIRAALLGRIVDADDPANYLLSPNKATQYIVEQLQAAKDAPLTERVKTATYAADLATVLQKIANTERLLGLSDGNTWGGEVVAALREIDKSMGDPDGGSDSAVDDYIGKGKLGDELHAELGRATAMPDAVAQVSSKTAMLASLKNKVQAEQQQRSAKRKEIIGNNPLTSEIAEMLDKVNKEYVDWLKETYHPVMDACLEVDKARVEAQRSALVVVGQKIIDKVTSESSITEDLARAWADAQEITDAAKARLRKQKYPVEKVRSDMADFYRLASGRIKSIRLHSKGDRRANATNIASLDNVSTINMDTDFDKRTLWHEMAHHVEADPVAKRIASRYIRRRSVDGGKVHKLRTLSGNKGYRSDEVAYSGNFFSPYVGKVYRDGLTEVFSMGLESFSDPAMLAKRAATDPETFELVGGFVTSPIHPLAKACMAIKDMTTEASAQAKEYEAEQIEDLWGVIAGKAGFVGNTAGAWINDKIQWSLREFKAVGEFGCDNSLHLVYGKARNSAGRLAVGYIIVKYGGGEHEWVSTFYSGKDIELAKATAYAISRRKSVLSGASAIQKISDCKELAND